MVDPKTIWNTGCSTETCYGVPLYRQGLTEQEKNGPPMPSAIPTPSIRLMGQDQAQRSSLTVNNATYYIDTTLDAAGQTAPPRASVSNVFEAGNTYYTYFLFAKPTRSRPINCTWQGSNWKPDTNVKMVRVRCLRSLTSSPKKIPGPRPERDRRHGQWLRPQHWNPDHNRRHEWVCRFLDRFQPIEVERMRADNFLQAGR